LVDADLGEVIEEARIPAAVLVLVVLLLLSGGTTTGGSRMPYCVVTAAAVAGGEQEEVRIFYQRYGHGATKVLLIIGSTFIFSLFLLFPFVSPQFSSIELNPCVQFHVTD
jgi:hypothetical protein